MWGGADNVNMRMKNGGKVITKHGNPIGFAFGVVATLLGGAVGLVVVLWMHRGGPDAK